MNLPTIDRYGKSRTFHPEQRSGEVYLGICRHDMPEVFNALSYQTKRKGINAYDDDGKLLPDYFPVFVLETECQQQEVKIGQ